MPHPWDTGDHERNWQGYFIPAMSVLRNRVGARTHAELRDAENDLVEARVIELREDPNLLGDRTDLAYLRAIHRQLFQDIYVWAGDLRTVGIEKEDESFCAPGGISRPMEHVAAEIYQLDRLRAVGEGDLAGQVAYRYDYVNYAHPFREGNGRSTREFFDLLLSERVLASTGGRPTWKSCTALVTWRAPTLISRAWSRCSRGSSTPSPLTTSDRTNLLMPISDTERCATPPVSVPQRGGFRGCCGVAPMR